MNYAAASPAKGLEGPVQTVRARHLDFGPLLYHTLTQEGSAWNTAGGLLLIALFWNAIGSITRAYGPRQTQSPVLGSTFDSLVVNPITPPSSVSFQPTE